MSEQAVIDNLEFARSGKALQGEIPVALLGRLRESLSSEQGAVNYTVAGKLGQKGERLLICRIDGDLLLQCQRCLESLPYPLHVVSTLKVVRGGSEFDALDDEDDEIDSIPADAAMNVLGLIEEEILLSLPLSPVHAPGMCREQGASDAVNEERTNPFGALAALKGKL